MRARRTSPKRGSKTCFTSWISDDTTLDKTLRLLSSVGCETVEISGNRENLARPSSIKSSLSRYGLNVATISAGVDLSQDRSLNLHARDEATRRESVDYVRQCVDFASYLEAPLVYVCSVTESRPGPKRSLELFAESLGHCLDHAEKMEVRLAVEPSPTTEIPTARAAGGLIDKVNSKSLGLLLDTGHMAINGEALKDTVKEWKRALFHVHLSNNDGSRDLHLPLQQGVITEREFRGMLRELRSGYSGVFSVELRNPEPLEDTVEETRDFVVSLLQMK